MENSPSTEIGPAAEIDSKLEKIHQNTSDEEHGGVLLFEEEKTLAEKRANEIYDSLHITLEEIAQEAARQAKLGSRSREANIVLNEILEATTVTKAFAKGEIEFEVDRDYQQKEAQKGDRIYSYKAENVLIGLKEYDIDLLIRPEAFNKIADIGRDISFEDDREQRFAMIIRPHKSEVSEIRVRIDPDDEIQFDIQADWVDILDLSAAGQKAGHHFSSGLKYADSRATFREVLEAMNTKVKVKGREGLAQAV